MRDRIIAETPPTPDLHCASASIVHGGRLAEAEAAVHDAADRPTAEWPAPVVGVAAADPKLGDQVAELVRAQVTSDSFLAPRALGLTELSTSDVVRLWSPARASGPAEIVTLLGTAHVRSTRAGSASPAMWRYGRVKHRDVSTKLSVIRNSRQYPRQRLETDD